MGYKMTRIRFFRDLDDAVRYCPASIDCDVVGIKVQAKRDCENPLAIWRDMVRVEIDLVEEGEVRMNHRSLTALRNYYDSLCGSC
jgi:hypothetical protein